MDPASVTIAAELCAVVFGIWMTSPLVVFRTVAPAWRIAEDSMRWATSRS